MIAALYIDPERGPYPALLGEAACWGIERDAKLYAGPGPVVAHPPCGPWGRLAHLCKYQDPDCGPRAVEQVRQFGGVLEHPRDSRLWAHCGMPRPSRPPYLFGPPEFTLAVEQCRWGHPCKKATWLFFSGIDPETLPPLPPWQEPTHLIDTNSRHKGQGTGGPHLPKSARHITPPAFAAWLIAAARAAQP